MTHPDELRYFKVLGDRRGPLLGADLPELGRRVWGPGGLGLATFCLRLPCSVRSCRLAPRGGGEYAFSPMSPGLSAKTAERLHLA